MHGLISHLPKVPLAIAVFAVLLTFAISFQSLGLYHGLEIGEQECDEKLASYEIQPSEISFSKGLTTYQEFSLRYGMISCLLFLVIIASLFLNTDKALVRQNIIAIGINVLLLILVVFNLRILIRDKGWVDSSFWDAPRNSFAKLTIQYDWLLIAAVGLIVLFQVVVVGLSYRNAKRIG